MTVTGPAVSSGQGSRGDNFQRESHLREIARELQQSMPADLAAPDLGPELPDDVLNPAGTSKPPSTDQLTSAMGLPSLSEAKVRRVWTPEEDEKLRLLVSYWGDQCGKNGHWDKISSHFANRTSKDCRKRWFHSLDPKLKRGRWTEHEDKVLVDAFKKMGPVWHRIAQLIPGRTDDQCSKRYNDVLDPNISNRLRSWSPEEDQFLLKLVKKYGTKWRHIAKEMDGRTGLTCRNRWRKLVSPSVSRDQSQLHQQVAQAQAHLQSSQPGSSLDLTSPGTSQALDGVLLPSLPSNAPLPNGSTTAQQQQQAQLKQDLEEHMSVSSSSSDEPPAPPVEVRPNPITGVPSASGVSGPPGSLGVPTANTTTTNTETHFTYSFDGPEGSKHMPLTSKDINDLVKALSQTGRQVILHQHNYHQHHHHHYYNETSSLGSVPGVVRPPTGTHQHHHDQHQHPPQNQAQGPTVPGRTAAGASSKSAPYSQAPLRPAGASTAPGGASAAPNGSSAATPSGLLAGIDLMEMGEDMLADFDEDIALDFESFEGIPFNPS